MAETISSWFGPIATVWAALVGLAALILNLLYIRIAHRQLGNADAEKVRLEVEIQKIKAETRVAEARLMTGQL